MKNSLLLHDILKVFCLSMFLWIADAPLFANSYRYSGSDTSWNGVDMTVSTGANYEWYAVSGGTYFDIILISPSTVYHANYIIAGFNGTDITTFASYSSENSCHVSSAPASYYVIVWLPNTAFNSSNNPVICASTTLPDDTALPFTYYYRGADNSWGADPMTVSDGGLYEYWETTTDNHQFKISTSTTSWDYNYTYVKAGFCMTSITSIGDFSSDNCYVWSAPAKYYIIVFKPNTVLNSASDPVISASATLPDDTPSGLAATKTIYFKPNTNWPNDNAKYAINAFGHDNDYWSDYMTPSCDPTIFQVEIPALYSDIIIARMNPAGTKDWNGKWNQSGDLRIPAGMNHLTQPSGTWNDFTTTWSTYSPTTYTITYNANGGTGSMAPITDICPSGSATLDANTFSNSGYVFAGWNTSDDGSGTDYADEATISSISADIILYAQWEVGCETLVAGAAAAGPSFVGSVGTVTVHNSNGSIKTSWDNSTNSRIYLATDQYIKLLPKAGKDFVIGDSLIVELQNISGSSTYITGFVIVQSNCSISISLAKGESHVFKYELTASDIGDDGSVRLKRYDNHAGFMTAEIKRCSPVDPTPTTIVDIPGTVNKDNVGSYSSDMTWYGASDEYFDFGSTDAPNTGRWAEWNVRLTTPGQYIVSVVVDFPASPNGYGWNMQLLDNEDNVVSTYTSINVWNRQEYTYDARWDLSAVAVGTYTLRVNNNYSYAQPKLKSITLSLPGISVSYTKVPNRDWYGLAGDPSNAIGTIDAPTVVETTGITAGSTVDTLANVLTIGGTTITAPLMVTGSLTGIPLSSGTTDANPDWRFLCWRNLPTGPITSDVTSIEAVYFPTFDVDYNTNGGTINDAEYTTWYEYTGIEDDRVPLPVDVTKPGYIFAGWYQTSTTVLFAHLTCNYFGDYSKGASCMSDACDYRLKAHWVLPCDEPQSISKVTLTGSGSSSYIVSGYNDNEYAGTPVVNVSAASIAADADGDGNNETGYQLGATNDIVFVTLSKGDFRIGDQIIITLTERNTSRIVNSATSYITLYYGTGTADAQVLVNKGSVTGAGVYTYTLDADDVFDMSEAGANGIGLFREAENGENPYVYSIEILGCRDLIFDDNAGTHVWSDAGNWAPTYTEIPSYYQSTRILKPCTVDIANAQAQNVKLCREYTGHDGSLTINADAALAVTSAITEVHGTDYVTTYPVSEGDILIKADASHQGALAHGDATGVTPATVQMYARGVNAPAATATWQYMGVPFSNITRAIEHYEGSWMCRWIENENGNAGSNWTWVQNEDALTPFVGYALTQGSAKTFTTKGLLVPSVNQTLSLTCGGTDYKGWNMFANSWMAPIQISQFEASDFGDGVEATIYIFNTGINDGQQADLTASSTAGQYSAVPIATAASMGAEYQYIAPMQGFYLLASKTSTVTLNYNRLVYSPTHGALSTRPNRAPRVETTNGAKEEIESGESESQIRNQKFETSVMPRLIIDVEGSRFSDRVYLFENTFLTDSFDNAWDGRKFEGEAYAPQLMTTTGDLDLAVDVSPSFGGKQLSFRAGEDQQYKLRFTTDVHNLRLRDLVTGAEMIIVNGEEYLFFADNKEKEIRFVIDDDRQYVDDNPTAAETLAVDAAQPLQLTIYTTDGRLILQRQSGFDEPLILPQKGVYIMQLKTTAGIETKKIIH